MPHNEKIDDDVYEAVLMRAESFDDDINTVLRRLLELPPKRGRGGKTKKETTAIVPTKRNKRTGLVAIPEREYMLPILEYLIDCGGKAMRKDCLNHIRKLFKSYFSPDDLEVLAGGDERWYKNADWARNKLRNAGYLTRSRKHGEWVITRSGRLWVQKERSIGPAGMLEGDSTRSDVSTQIEENTMAWLSI